MINTVQPLIYIFPHEDCFHPSYLSKFQFNVIYISPENGISRHAVSFGGLPWSLFCTFLIHYTLTVLYYFSFYMQHSSLNHHNLRTEPKHIVFLSKLLLLFQFCHICRSEIKPTVTATQNGTEVVIKTACNNPSCGKDNTWNSQPLLPGTRTAAGNFLLCMATLFAGGSFTKVAQIFQHMGLSCISLNTFFTHQRVSST